MHYNFYIQGSKSFHCISVLIFVMLYCHYSNWFLIYACNY